ncbi:MAG: GIY-YIG nuclease family protein [Candidatus Gastranaerophilaceae bacterium]|jgi:putative endonuclease
MDEKHYTYLLLTKNNTLYCGYTNNLERRFKKHVEGTASKYTRANKPEKFVYIEEYTTKSDALKAEVRIKNLTRKQKETLIKLFRHSS